MLKCHLKHNISCSQHNENTITCKCLFYPFWNHHTFLYVFCKQDFILINDENENRVKTTVANMSTIWRVYIPIDCNKDLLVKNIVFTANIHYLRKGTDFEVVILLKSIFERNSWHKKSGIRTFTKQIGPSYFTCSSQIL